jgi:Zn-dependent protease with chaperone function
MARRFTRRRWRRPQRLTLEGPPPARRKDLVMPDVLTLEHDLQWHENRRRMGTLLISFLGLALAEGIVVGLLTPVGWLGPPVAFLLALTYIVFGARFGDGWMHRVLGAQAVEWPEASNRLQALAGAVKIPAPELLVTPGEAPNGLALGLRRRWIVLTSGSRGLERMELEAVLAHELVHLRDGDAALAAAYVLIAGCADLGTRGLRGPAGILALVALPLWPAALAIRAMRGWFFPSDREHRADVCGAMLTRYPPGMHKLLVHAEVEHGSGSLGAADPFWFAPRTTAGDFAIGRRAELVSEL